jgi:hypothetical protein
MSAMTIKKLASQTITDTDEILKKWSEAFCRGDVSREQVPRIMDCLLDLRSAAGVMAAPTTTKRKQGVST